MRVLLLNQTFYPDQAATSQQLLDLAKYLKKEGCDVTVVASRRAYLDPKKIHPAQDTIEGIRVLRVHSTGFGRRSFFLSAGRRAHLRVFSALAPALPSSTRSGDRLHVPTAYRTGRSSVLRPARRQMFAVDDGFEP